VREEWSRHSDLNRGPAVYETGPTHSPVSAVGRLVSVQPPPMTANVRGRFGPSDLSAVRLAV